MADDAKSHRKWAKRCEAFYNKLGGSASDDPEWALTALFYAAVHEVQAFLISRQATLAEIPAGIPITHGDRMDVLRARWKKLAPMYEDFLDKSKQARYDLWEPAEDDLKEAEELLARIRAQLATYK